MEKLLDPVPSARERNGLSNGMPFRLLSDHRLARCASSGDRRAMAAIFERYQQELYRFCLGLLGEPQDAQDAVQNTVVKALRALPGERRRIELRPWLYRIAHNEAIELRRRERATEVLDEHPVEVRSSLVEQAEAREQLGWLLKDLGNLPERQRAVLVMRELSGLDFAEIGAALGTSGTVVRQSLYEARRSLQRMDFGRNLKCEVVTRAISDADGRVTRRKDIRAHLRACSDCRKFQETIRARTKTLAAISPMPTVVTASLLQAASGGSAGAGSGGLIGAIGFGVAKSAGAPGVLKLAAAAAALAAIGTVSVDRPVDPVAPESSPSETRSAQDRDLSSAPSYRSRRDAALSQTPPRASLRAAPAPPRQASIERTRSAALGSEGRDGADPISARTQIVAVPATGEPGAYAVGDESKPRSESKPYSDQAVNPETSVEHSSKPAKDQPSQSAAGAKSAGKATPAEHAAHPTRPEHPPHPEHPQKPAASGELLSTPEAVPLPVGSEAPGEESAAPGLAKGKEKHAEP